MDAALPDPIPHLADPRTALVRDPQLPALGELLAQPLPGPIRVALTEAGVVPRQVVVRQVSWSPGVRARVTYDVLVEDRSTAEGVTWLSQVVAGVGRLPEGAYVVGDGSSQVAVWRVPHDPALPGLASALDPGRAGELLTALGAAGDDVRTTLRAYRPGRRAVVSVSGRTAGLYLKVLRPAKVEGVHRRHQQLTGSLPITRSLGFDADLGVLALQAMPGITLREALDSGVPRVPGAALLTALLDRLPEPAPGQLSLSPLQRVADTTANIAAILPEYRTRAEEVAAALGEEPIGDDATGDLIPVHGDFYEAQVLVEGSRLTGLIDVDTYGWGRPGDDPATLLGHLSVYRAMAPRPELVAEYGAAALAWWEQRLDRADLRRRVGATVFSLAPGAFRAQSNRWPEELLRRLELAAMWVGLRPL